MSLYPETPETNEINRQKRKRTDKSIRVSKVVYDKFQEYKIHLSSKVNKQMNSTCALDFLLEWSKKI